MKIDKISFFEADDEAFENCLSVLSPEWREEAREAVRYYLSSESDFEYAFSVVGECLVVRIFDLGRYCFVFPAPLSDFADIDKALEESVRYAVLEEIEAVFIAVPFEQVSSFARIGYRHFNLDAESETAESYRVTLKNEIMLAEKFPVFADEKTEFSFLRESDAKDYARLCRDKDSEALFGYSVTEDYPDASDSTFIEICERELEYGTALTYAVRAEGKLVGELSLHNFDYKGGADIAIRILPEHRRLGHAGRALSLILDNFSSLGLVRLYARVFNENSASLSLFSKRAEFMQKSEGVTVFTYGI